MNINKQILQTLNWLKKRDFGGGMAMGIIDFDPWEYAYGVILQCVEEARAEEALKYSIQQSITSSNGTSLTLGNIEILLDDGGLNPTGKELIKQKDNQSRNAVMESFREFCQNEVPEKRLSDEHYVLISLLIDSFLSQTKGDKR